MALCVTLQADGTLVPTGEPIEQCTGYALVAASEHSVYQLVHTAFSTPTPEQAAGWFIGGFGAVMVFYVAARCAGAVVNMFR